MSEFYSFHSPVTPNLGHGVLRCSYPDNVASVCSWCEPLWWCAPGMSWHQAPLPILLLYSSLPLRFGNWVGWGAQSGPWLMEWSLPSHDAQFSVNKSVDSSSVFPALVCLLSPSFYVRCEQPSHLPLTFTQLLQIVSKNEGCKVNFDLYPVMLLNSATAR